MIVFGCDKIPGWEGGDGSEKYPPKWVPPVDRMIFISSTCILTGREALAGREGRAGWVDRKKDAKNCMFKNPHFRIVFVVL